MKKGSKRRRIRFQAQQVDLRIHEYLKMHSDAAGSVHKLLDAGCDEEILYALAWGHCLGGKGNPDSIVPDMFERLERGLGTAAQSATGLMNCFKDLGYGVDVVKEFELDTLWLSLKKHEHICHLAQRINWSPPREKIQKIWIHLPLLCVYVKEVAKKPHYADIAALLRAFYAAGEIETKEHLTSDAVRKVDERADSGRRDLLKAATKTFLKTRSLAGKHPSRLLLTLAYMEAGLLPLRSDESGQSSS